MSNNWHYKHGGEERGPISTAELKRLAAEGELLPDDKVWREGTEKWVPARTVKGLFAERPSSEKAGGPPPLPASGGPAARNAPLALDEAGQDDEPAKTQPGGLLQNLTAAWQKMPTGGKIGLAGGGLLFVLVVCCGGFAFVGSRFMGGGDSTLDAAKLARDYDADRKAADAKYKGKTLTVTGIIDIPYKGQGFATVHLEVPDGLKTFPMVTADFGAKHEAELRKLRRGDTIRFRGLCEGDTAKAEHGPSVHFINCELISPGTGGGDGASPDKGKTTNKTAPPGRGTKADFIARLRTAAGPTKVGLRDGKQTYAFPGKDALIAKMGRPDAEEKVRDEVPFELLGEVVTETLTYRCTDGTLVLNASAAGWYTILWVEDRGR